MSTKIEADTLMILHANELFGEVKIVHFLIQDTDVLLQLNGVNDSFRRRHD